MKRFIIIVFSLLVFANNDPFETKYIHVSDNGYLSISGDSIDLRSIIIEIVSTQNKSVVFTQDIASKVSLYLDHVTWGHALEHILLSKHLVSIELNNAIYIGNKSTISKIQQHAHTISTASVNIQLKYRNIREFVQLMLEKKVIQSEDVLLVNDKDNSLTCKANHHLKHYAQIFDAPEQQIRLKAYIISADQDYIHELGLALFHDHNMHQSQDNMWYSTMKKIGDFLDIKMKAMESLGRGKLLSSPELITKNNTTAFIETGEAIPYLENTTDNAATIVFKKAVLSLSVMPRILPHNKIDLHVIISQDQPGNMYSGAVAIKTRKIDTNTVVASGKTLVLGGIFETNNIKNVAGIPFLKDVPIAGKLFSAVNKNHQKRQLIIFIIPEIVND